MTEPLTELTGVSVEFRAPGSSLLNRDRVHALTDVDLTVTAGETLGVVGESGCGKSTLVKVLVGLQRPVRGTVRLDGEDIWALSAARRRRHVGSRIGMVFQDPATSLNRRLPVEQIIVDPLDVQRWRSPRDRQARVTELMDLVGLPSSARDALPSQMSGGQRQRVAIARALALEPALLIADEPTSALDVSVRAQILNLLLDLRARLGLAMVFVSHDLQTVRRVSDRIVTMYLGRVVEELPAGSIHEGRHPYTRALFSAAPGLLHPMRPIPLSGPVPSAVRPPSGCPFRTRCWRAADDCAAEMPPYAADGRYRCFHPVTTPSDLPVQELA
ncbi:putative ABC transporter ATP-binding protein [Actinoplanes missouriensis 431]|uniref:Putative ABC transporter ATP-binding protein n=1 Tax=Actinoplanes missouriensis (strain ATCC 14538 / DSM 43046 / CBS 188.64 / JCM 3121 / NBRC 102363 / NCIMB 12654 / NRRL B-3342 / UNCC 431) TaxID=512565 RepID=I0H3U3_ACTM4|nr:ABC transporter ATP-binding protein [Actinoplanes missouriensis]BAL87680.1 putative ABC transporter ATP-binding protein [Actinoplanes missouriensis 431]